MKTYIGGTQVPRGMYFNLKTGEFLDLYQGKQELPGTSLQTFARVPRWLPFVAGPVGGLFFVIFLPLAGLVGLVSGALIKSRVLRGIWHQVGRKPAAVVK